MSLEGQIRALSHRLCYWKQLLGWIFSLIQWHRAAKCILKIFFWILWYIRFGLPKHDFIDICFIPFSYLADRPGDVCEKGLFTLFTLYYTTLHCNTQHFTTLHCNTQHFTVLHNTTLYYTTLHCTTQHFTVLHNTSLHYTTLHCTTQNYTAQHCIAEYYTAEHCRILHSTALHKTILHKKYSTTPDYSTQFCIKHRNRNTVINYTTLHCSTQHYTDERSGSGGCLRASCKS